MSTPNSPIRLYLRTKRHAREARAWLRGNPEHADRIAASCLYHLNTFAKGTPPGSRAAIYAAKDRMIAVLSERGHLVRKEVHAKDHVCWGCNGTGENVYGETCYRCNGSGVWSRETFDYYVFNVQGQPFAWHSPRPDSQRPPDTKPYAGNGRLNSFSGADIRRMELYYITVVEYLAIRGKPLDARLTPTLGWTVCACIGGARTWVRRRYRRLQRAIRAARWRWFDRHVPF